MNFVATPLAGAYLVEPVRMTDERGWFLTTFSEEEFARRGLECRWVRSASSFNLRRGTLRGMHYQAEPHAEAKLVGCTRGAIHDVLVDLRPGSLTRGRWFAAVLSAENRRLLFAPRGFAHGFQTLEDDTEVTYHLSAAYHPEAGRGVRWNDPAIGIHWPLEVSVISERDRGYADYSP